MRPDQDWGVRVSGTGRFERMLRWYPPSWRARYGGELTALLEDTYGASDVPFRGRLSIVKAGAVERARWAGVLGDSTGPTDRVRAGSLLVLCAWSVFVIAGAIFAKFSEGWRHVAPTAVGGLPNDAYHAVVWAGAAGGVVVAVAAFVVLPAFVRLVRATGWTSIRRLVLSVVVVGVTAVALTAGGVVWAHHLSSRDRNGGLLAYGMFFVLCGLAIVAAIATSTGAAVSVTRRLDLSPRTLRVLGAMAVALTLIMTVMVAGALLWWGAVATRAPQVLRNGIGNGVLVTSDTVPSTLVGVGVLMLIGLGTAAMGTVRVARSLTGTSTVLNSSASGPAEEGHRGSR
jgi:hypothetical protein